MKFDRDIQMIENPNSWPQADLLCMKTIEVGRDGMPDCALLQVCHKHTRVNLKFGIKYEIWDYEGSLIGSYDSGAEVVKAGWRVD